MDQSQTVADQSAFPYRPSSIKSFQESNERYINDNSSPSLKQCADQMMPLGRNSKIEISYPSFLNMSSDQNKDNGNSNSVGKYGLSPEAPVILEEQYDSEFKSSSNAKIQTDNELQEEKVEFKIQFQTCDQMNLSNSNKSSREASIVRKTRQVNDKLEESMEIIIDNLRIKTKRTTTPKRVLSSYTQSRRSKASASLLTHSNVISDDQSQLSQSELSNSFNVSNYSCQGDKENIPEQNIAGDQTRTKKGSHQRKISNSCGQNKRRSFIQAVLSQNKIASNQDNNIRSQNSEIYSKQEINASDQEESNLMMSQSENSSQKTLAKNIQNQSLAVYHLNQDKSNFQSQNQSQVLQQHSRYSQILQQDCNYNRQSLGIITQTDDNGEIEYSISNSCTPNSKNTESNIKRKINFDETSGDGQQNSGFRFTDGSNKSKYITSFSLGLGSKIDQTLPIIVTKKSNPSQNMNACDNSQSFIFNQACQSPPQIQPFNEENFVSNIKSTNSPSNQGNTTQFMMLTEEKFKNLKSEISQQQEGAQYLISQNTLLCSPSINDFGNLTKFDTSRLNQQNQSQNQVQNLSTFIQQSKYLQVYENYRRGFSILAKFSDKNIKSCIEKFKFNSQQQKLKKYQTSALVKIINEIIKKHISNDKSFGLKRIKKFYKEQQLQIFIQKKQNQFAIQTSALVKLDQLIISHSSQNVQYALNALIKYNQQLKQVAFEKRQRASQQILSMLSRKLKTIEDKALRNIFNWVNEKRIIEMNLKLLSRVLNKIAINQKRVAFMQVKIQSTLKAQQTNSVAKLLGQLLQRAFNLFKDRIQLKQQRIEGVLKLGKSLQNTLSKIQVAVSFGDWKLRALRLKILNSVLLNKQTSLITQAKSKSFKVWKIINQNFKERVALLKSNKASLLFLFKKLDDLRKHQLNLSFSQIKSLQKLQDNSIILGKSNTQTNLSVNTQQNNIEMSLVLLKKKVKASNSSMLLSDKHNYRTQQQVIRTAGKDTKGQAKIHYQTQRGISTQGERKPKLNDYLSYSPHNIAEGGTKQNLNKFFSRRKTDAQPQSGKAPKDTLRQEKTYIDSVRPLQDFREGSFSQRIMHQTQQSFENMNQLNLSIKDMNQAFRDQMSRIKEKQEDENDQSYISSFQNITCNDQSLDQKLNKIQIELSQTPDQLNYLSNDKVNKKSQFIHTSKNISPKINPLCTSESYQVLKGMISTAQTQHQFSQDTNLIQQRLKPAQTAPINIQLSDMSNQYTDRTQQIPVTSTFRANVLTHEEDIEECNELKFNNINQLEQPLTHRDSNACNVERQNSGRFSNKPYGQSTSRRKSDQRYQQQSSFVDNEFSIDNEQQHDMFDEFEKACKEEKQPEVKVKHNASNVSVSYVKNSMADLSKRIDFSQMQDISQDFVELNAKRRESQNYNPIQNAYKNFKQQQIQDKTKRLTGNNKVFQISPKFQDESFVPSSINRDLLNEMAQNYQMMELTPEADYHMLLNNKSLFQKEDSIYSNNQYADPMEMALSPRGVIADVSAINQIAMTTNHSQLNCYTQPEQEEEDNDYGQEISQIIEQGRDSRPYDFELSSNSKFKIISQNLQAKKVLTSESAQPSMIVSHNNICKKLSFGYEIQKKQAANQSKQKSTLIMSGGEQTINFNLTQEEEDNHHASDEELDVGEEIPAEITNKLNLNLPQSHIYQQELQEEKINMSLSQSDLMQITHQRLQMLKKSQQFQSSQDFQKLNTARQPQSAQDFISSNVQKLRNIMRVSPTYEVHNYQEQEIKQRVNSANNSTRNIYNKNMGIFSSKTNPVPSVSEIAPIKPSSLNRQAANKNEKSYIVQRSLAQNNRTHHIQQKTHDNQSKPLFIGPGNNRQLSKENISTAFTGQRNSFQQLTHQPSVQSLRDKSQQNNLRNSGNYQPLTFRASQQNPQLAQNHQPQVFGQTMPLNNPLFDRRVSYQDQSETPAFTFFSGNSSQRGSQANINPQRSRNAQNGKLSYSQTSQKSYKHFFQLEAKQ